MTQKPDNPQAFPVLIENWGGEVRAETKGMTLRDYFAAASLQGILARPNTSAEYDPKSEVASHCYGYADAMLKEREVTND